MGNTIETAVSEEEESYDTTTRSPDTEDFSQWRSQTPENVVDNHDGRQVNDCGMNDGYGDGGTATRMTVRRQTRGQRRWRTTDGLTTVADGADVPSTTGGGRQQPETRHLSSQRRQRSSQRRHRSSQRRQRSSQRRPRLLSGDEYDYGDQSTDSDRSNHVIFLPEIEQPPEATTKVRRSGRKYKRPKTAAASNPSVVAVPEAATTVRRRGRKSRDQR